MDRFHAMNVFVAVADLRGFAPAARRLKLSPSVVTRLIASLEDHVGARLLQRTTRSVALTEAGVRYHERARRILADVAEAESAAQADRTQPTGRLVIAAPNLFGRIHVAPALTTFLVRHQAIVGELALSDRLVSLVDEGVDVAIRIGVLDDSSLVARSVGATRRVLVAAPKYLAKRPKLRTPSDVRDHDTIHLTAFGAAPELRFASGRSVNIAPRLVTNSADAALTHARLGGGITTALGYQVAADVRARKLEVVLADHEVPPLPIHLVTPTARMLPAKVRAFVEHVASTSDWRFVDF